MPDRKKHELIEDEKQTLTLTNNITPEEKTWRSSYGTFTNIYKELSNKPYEKESLLKTKEKSVKEQNSEMPPVKKPSKSITRNGIVKTLDAFRRGRKFGGTQPEKKEILQPPTKSKRPGYSSTE